LKNIVLLFIFGPFLALLSGVAVFFEDNINTYGHFKDFIRIKAFLSPSKQNLWLK
jgi:hypothetical protein